MPDEEKTEFQIDRVYGKTICTVLTRKLNNLPLPGIAPADPARVNASRECPMYVIFR